MQFLKLHPLNTIDGTHETGFILGIGITKGALPEKLIEQCTELKSIKALRLYEESLTGCVKHDVWYKWEITIGVKSAECTTSVSVCGSHTIVSLAWNIDIIPYALGLWFVTSCGKSASEHINIVFTIIFLLAGNLLYHGLDGWILCNWQWCQKKDISLYCMKHNYT